MPKRVLALDVSASSTGYAFDAPCGTRPILGTLRLPTAADDYGLPGLRFLEWLDFTIAGIKPDLIVYEAPMPVVGKHASTRPTNQHTVRMLLGLAMVVEIAAKRAGIDCRQVHIGTVKKSFAGHGRAEKADVIARCRQLGWEPKNADEADAAAVWGHSKAVLDQSFTYRITPLLGRPAA